MSSALLKNFLGIRQSDFEKLSVPNPRLEYGLVLTIRGAEIGTLIGSLVGALAPLVANNKCSCGAKEGFTRGGIAGALVGSYLGAIFAMCKIRRMGTLELYNSCYLRRFDTAASNLDRACFLGATLGYIGYGPFGCIAGVDFGLVLCSLFVKKN